MDTLEKRVEVVCWHLDMAFGGASQYGPEIMGTAFAGQIGNNGWQETPADIATAGALWLEQRWQDFRFNEDKDSILTTIERELAKRQNRRDQQDQQIEHGVRSVGYHNWCDTHNENDYRKCRREFFILPDGTARIVTTDAPFSQADNQKINTSTEDIPPGEWRQFTPVSNFGSRGGDWIERRKSE